VSRRVLIVEDEYIVAADLEATLANMGYAMIGIAASGEEAVSIAGEQRPDIVVMDIKLRTAMSGHEAAQIIQRQTGAAVIFITAYAGFRDDRKGMPQAGIWLSKPFSEDQLKLALDAAGAQRPANECDSKKIENSSGEY